MKCSHAEKNDIEVNAVIENKKVPLPSFYLA